MSGFFLSSSCIYPRLALQPMREEFILSRPSEETNLPHPGAKIAGMKRCEAYHRQDRDGFFNVLSTNVYGRNGNFDLASSQVLPALIRKFIDARASNARNVTKWRPTAP